MQVDPGVVVKLSGARIEAERGSAHVIAEGTPDNPVIFTSLNDDRFGAASGTFDTSNNGLNTIGENTAGAGDWAACIASVHSEPQPGQCRTYMVDFDWEVYWVYISMSKYIHFQVEFAEG